ncbi:phospholipase D-like domain-containing protein [Arcanobacterium bovis]|uniref:Phosphatidylserine/phosphatidylglycerophosphate/ cardiolipin synthase family protein n=1 Tax=Arcanobacterium bovis TaxID=2529275 RepID=A0A4Q9UYP7_9ACTO|nr:phospholipase D-like domain-containing protein [Arcanobacterium bovis]TBW20812.1 phosphatidylserine/phosphatidylglycerophosphate/cardiolipin synthase family protein [Arcanobacterium bovis]
MIRTRRQQKETLKRMLKWGVGGLLTAQAAAIATVSAIDAHRKRRNPDHGDFPHLEPLMNDLSDHDVTIYTYGEDLYEAQLNAIRDAEHHIYFENFIMKDDFIGNRFKDELINAAHRGVSVYIILDTWGNLNQPPRFRKYPKHPNIHVLLFPLLRPGIITGQARKKGRDHRKIICVDSQIGFVGGYNIGDLFAHHWRDTHIRVRGPQVWELENAFVDMWNIYRYQKIHPELPDVGAGVWAPHLRAVTNTPAFNSFPVRALYLEAIDRASKNIWITMGYFIPDQGLKFALLQAAKRGVDVRILLPEYSNHIVADWVGRPHYAELLRGGVRIFRYRKAMVHAKTMTVDGVWSTVGTTNIDRLSMAGNFEVNVEIFSEEIAQSMEKIFRLDLTNTSELLLDEWESRGKLSKLGERLLGPLGPLL